MASKGTGGVPTSFQISSRSFADIHSYFAPITHSGRRFGGRPTLIVRGEPEDAELFGKITAVSSAYYHRLAEKIYGQRLPRGTKVRTVEDAIVLTETGGGVRQIRGVVKLNRETIYLQKGEHKNPVLLADEFSHVLFGKGGHKDHVQAFNTLQKAVRSGKITLTPAQTRELAESLKAVARGK